MSHCPTCRGCVGSIIFVAEMIQNQHTFPRMDEKLWSTVGWPQWVELPVLPSLISPKSRPPSTATPLRRNSILGAPHGKPKPKPASGMRRSKSLTYGWLVVGYPHPVVMDDRSIVLKPTGDVGIPHCKKPQILEEDERRNVNDDVGWWSYSLWSCRGLQIINVEEMICGNLGRHDNFSIYRTILPEDQFPRLPGFIPTSLDRRLPWHYDLPPPQWSAVLSPRSRNTRMPGTAAWPGRACSSWWNFVGKGSL